MTAARAALSALLLAVAFGGGYLASAARPAPDGTMASLPATVVVTRPAAGVTADEIRAIVRDELARMAPAVEADAAPVIATPAAAVDVEGPPPAARAVAAESVIASAIGRGRWTRDDAERLRGELRRLDPVAARHAMSSLHVAANAGRFRVETGGPLLAAE